MQIIKDTAEFHIKHQTAVALGKFDGLHRGHQALLSYILKQKERGLKATVFTFSPSPTAFFCAKEGKGWQELTTQQEKRRLFEDMGVDILIEFPLNDRTAATEPEQFVRRILAEQVRAVYIAAGEDLSFGAGGKGNRMLLESMSEECGYQTEIIRKLYYGEREISSSYVREVLGEGKMEIAESLLGRPYSVLGQVQEGNRLGRRLGMPTLNLYPADDKLLPPRGVYYARILFGQKVYAGITNIGCKPTVNDTQKISVESYLYDFQGDLYGEEIVTELLQFRRPEQKFEDTRALKARMEEDIAAGEQFHKEKSLTV